MCTINVEEDAREKISVSKMFLETIEAKTQYNSEEFRRIT